MDPHRSIILFPPFISHHVEKLRDKIMKNFVPLELDKSNGRKKKAMEKLIVLESSGIGWPLGYVLG